MMLKIVPFLVWYRVYSPRAGKAPVPTLAQLSWPRGETATRLLLTLGMVLLPIAVAAGNVEWIRVAGAVLSAGAITFGLTIGHIVRHLVRPVSSTPAPAAAHAR